MLTCDAGNRRPDAYIVDATEDAPNYILTLSHTLPQMYRRDPSASGRLMSKGDLARRVVRDSAYRHSVDPGFSVGSAATEVAACPAIQQSRGHSTAETPSYCPEFLPDSSRLKARRTGAVPTVEDLTIKLSLESRGASPIAIDHPHPGTTAHDLHSWGWMILGDANSLSYPSAMIANV
jgi:hypothetical protein